MKNVENMSLEEIMAELEKTVEQLENASLPLEKSMELFESGVRLTARAQALLDGYTKRITVLKKENGVLSEADMEDEDDG